MLGTVGGVPVSSLFTSRVTPRLHLRTPPPALFLVMALGAGVAVATWPGAMNTDALSQIGQVRSGRYNDWHSGVLVPMWRPLYALGLGAGWVYLGSVVLLAFGLYELLASAMGRRTAGFVTAGLLAYPPVLGLVVYWGRDQWFVGALLAAAASLVAMAGSGDRHTRATIAFTVSVWAMLASRQNAPPAAFVLAVAAMVHGGLGARQTWLTRLGPGRCYGALRAIALGLAAGAVVAIMLLSQEAIRRVAGVSHVHPEQQTLFYDLAAISIDTGDNWFPAVVYAGDVETLAESFSVVDVLPLVARPDPVISPLRRGAYSELLRAWAGAVVRQPGPYVQARWNLFMHQLAITGPAQHVFHDQVDPNEWGYEFLLPDAFSGVASYLQASTPGTSQDGGPLHAVWGYVLVTVGGLGWFRSARIERRMLAWVCAATLANTAGLFFVAAAASYRFTWPSVVVGCVVVVVWGADLARAARPPAPGPARTKTAAASAGAAVRPDGPDSDGFGEHVPCR